MGLESTESGTRVQDFQFTVIRYRHRTRLFLNMIIQDQLIIKDVGAQWNLEGYP